MGALKKILIPAGLVASTLSAQPVSNQITLLPVIPSGLTQPVGIVHAGDNTNRLFIIEQPGKIRVWKEGALLDSPFLDLGGVITGCSATCGGERGLLGLAFHPDYENNGYFYVYYTRNGTASETGDLVIARYHVSADPDVADSASALRLLTIEHTNQGNHNGGNLAFKPTSSDPYLYIGTGDGGGTGDPGENGQDLNELLGKFLRVDVGADGEADGFPAEPERNYGIPPSNPFPGPSDGLDEIWSYGLRNPWRWSFDRLLGGLYVADVGQGAREEIDFEPFDGAGGINYGWDCREGPDDYTDPNGDFNATCVPDTSVDPVLWYDHSAGNCSVTGGFVYRGDSSSGGSAAFISGNYIFGDYCSGRIWRGFKTGASWSSPELFDTTYNVSAFGEDESGKLYIADRTGGSLYRIAPYSFTDVFPDDKSWTAIESLYLAQVSQGCGGGRYCSDDPVQRQQMAVLLERVQDPFTPPDPCAGSPFADVDATFCPWVQAAIADGIAAECDDAANRFCATNPVSRTAMAKMLLRAVHGSGYSPAFPCGGTDAASDVTTAHPYCDWVNSALKENLMATCDLGLDRFCPDNGIRRDQLAALLVTAFPGTVPVATP